MIQKTTEDGIPFDTIRLYGRTFKHVQGISVATIASFLERVQLPPRGREGCWQWMGGRWRNAYGGFTWQKRTIAAHRFSWIAFRGAIEPGNEIHHKCESPSCVNPEHLQQLTKSEHIAAHSHDNPVFQKRFNTHCVHGHELSGDNLRIVKDAITGRDHRRCRQCGNEWSIAKWRRNNPQADRIKRTHCKNGHEFTPENTYEYLGKRQCKTCHTAACMVHYEKHLSPRVHPRPPKPPRTECKHGHPWVPENLYPIKDRKGKQVFICKTCYQISTAKAYAKLKAKHSK